MDADPPSTVLKERYVGINGCQICVESVHMFCIAGILDILDVVDIADIVDIGVVVYIF